MRRIPVLNEPILVQTKQKARGPIGNTRKAYAPGDTIWAKVEDLTGEELFLFKTTYPTASTKFTIRHTSEISNTHRIVHQSINYDILYIRKIRRDQYLEIITESSPK